MIYLLLMTGAGSILYGLYGIWTKICGRYLNHSMKYKMLIIVLLVHLIPLVGLRMVYSFLLVTLLPKQTIPQSDLSVGMADISTASEAYVTPDYRWTILIAVIWTTFTVLRLLKSCFSYLINRHALKKVSEACHCETGVRIVERLKPQYRIKRPIEVIQVDGNRTPYTVGAFRPIIVLYGEYDDSEMEWVLKHELTHIVRGDVLLRLLLELVCCLYWFNPILIGFRQCFNKECESSCDERVTFDRTEEERDAYAKLLERFMNDEQDDALGAALSGDHDYIKERINEIMNIRKMKRWQKIVTASVFAVFMMADSLVALAYPDVYHVEDKKDKVEATADIVEAADSFWVNDVKCEDMVFEVLFDEEFIDETGTIIPVNSNQPYVFCLGHKWQSGYFQSHLKDDNGGCTIYIYSSQLCPVCNTIVIEDLYAKYYYATCTH